MLRYFFCLSFVVAFPLHLIISVLKSYTPKRRWLRCLFGLLLVLILLSVGSVLYLNQIGLPGFAKRGVQKHLAELGIKLDFDWLRMDLDGTWKARQLTFGQTDSGGELGLSLDDATVFPDYLSFFSGQPSVKEFGISGLGLRAEVVVGETNLPPVSLVWPKAGLYWSGGHEVLSSTNLQGSAFGFNLDISLSITNALVLRNILQNLTGKSDRTRSSSSQDSNLLTSEIVARKLRPIKSQLASLLESRRQIHFQKEPIIKFSFKGDAGDPESLSGCVAVEAEEFRFPIGGFDRFKLELNLFDEELTVGDQERFKGEFKLDGLDTGWAKSESLLGRASSSSLATNLLPESIEYQIESTGIESGEAAFKVGSLKGSAIQLQSKSGYFKHRIYGLFRELTFDQKRLKSIDWNAALTNSLANPLPNRSVVNLSLASYASSKVGFDSADITANVSRVDSSIDNDESWDYWAKLAPYKIHFNSSTKSITEGENLIIDDLLLEGKWEAPNLIMNQFDANFEQGGIRASAELDVETRLVKATSSIDFDLYKIIDHLSPKAQRWIQQFKWGKAPVVSSTIQATLPKWTDKNPDWRAQISPSIVINGKVNSGPLSFRGIELDGAQTDLQYTNQVWLLPNLVARRAEGDLKFALRSQTDSRDFHFDFHSTINPRALIPALKDEKQKRAFDFFVFKNPPVIEGQIWGRWREPDQTGFYANFGATNFTFRAQHVDSMTAGVALTNGVFNATNVVLARPEGVVTLDSLALDVGQKRLYLTNGVGRVDPAAVSKAIGPKTARALEPYHFIDPPKVKVNGWIQTGPGRNPASLHVEVDGGAFKFNRFNSRDMNGEIFWTGNTITLTNVVSEFYGGELNGDLFAKFNSKQSSEIDFHLQTKQTNLTGFMSDVLGRDSGLSGQIDGVLDINALSKDWSSWNGSASMALKDGYLWELPLLSVFSPILDQMAPGLGAGKFSKGTGDFKIVNSIVKTRNVELKSPLVRLQYTGNVDFEGRISDAGVAAEPLRDAWVIGPVLGPVLNLALKPIERMLKFKVEGTLNKPKMELKHIPKILLVPVQIPLKLFDDIVPDDVLTPKTQKKSEQKD